MDHRQVAGRFNACFGGHCGLGLPRTLLVGGAAEPLYLPPADARPAVIRYAHDYATSALHEIAHWCLATPAERRLVDYGLSYRPPPRAPAEQALFYAAEVPVQALEMLLAAAAGVTFHFSADNPGVDDDPARAEFEHRVRIACRRLLEVGPGGPAEILLTAFCSDWRQRLGAEAGIRAGTAMAGHS